MTGRGLRVTTVGEALGVLRAPNVGSLAHTMSLELGTGGAEANFAIGLARLGLHVTWLGRVGDDGLGKRIIRELRAEGVDVLATFDPTWPTGLLIKETPAPGRTTVSYYRAESAGSRLEPSDIDRLDLRDSDLLHITGITSALSASAAATIRRLIECAHEAGVRVSFDVNHRTKLWAVEEAAQHYRWIAARSDLIFGDPYELGILTGTTHTDPQVAAERVAEEWTAEIIVKLGDQGAAVLADGTWQMQDAVPVDVVDTVGAGDAFAAGYIAERLNGGSVSASLRLATKTGAAACAHPGDWEGIPFRRDLETDTGIHVVDR